MSSALETFLFPGALIPRVLAMLLFLSGSVVELFLAPRRFSENFRPIEFVMVVSTFFCFWGIYRGIVIAHLSSRTL